MSQLDELYMNRRLSIMGRAQDLTPSMQFDLASSGLSNPELEEAVSHFNPVPQKEGWGFANVFEEMLSREPRKVPVEDLATLQNNLKNQGYLPGSHPADGVWGPDSAAAFSQLDRDNGDQVTQGNSILAGTLVDGIKFFGSMLPRSVIQGVIGTAKGLVTQLPETLERGGLIGGALEGAAIGGAGGAAFAGVGAIPGAIGGAIIGGIGGLLSSLLDNDDEDGNGNSGFMDALHPFNEGEWTTARNFAEDVGYVASAASLIAGGAAAVGGARALTTGGIMAAGSKAGASTLRGSLMALDPVTKPGFVMNMLGTAKGSAALGAFAGGAHGLATGDDFGDMVEQAAIGGVAGYAVGASPVGAKLRDLAASYGLKRISTNPLVKGVNSVFTGGVMANVGGRYAGGFGSGEKDTEIEKSIREAPVMVPEWVDLVGGMVLLPERILPVSVGEIGSAARKMMGDVAKRPYWTSLEQAVDAAGKPLKKSVIRELVDNIGPEQDIYSREQFGIHQLAKWQLEAEKVADIKAFRARADLENVYAQSRNEVWDWYRSTEATDDAGRLKELESKKNLVMSLSTSDPSEYSRELIRLENEGSGVRNWSRFDPAQSQAEHLAMAAREGNLDYGLGTAPPVSKLDDEIARLEARVTELQGAGQRTSKTETALAGLRTRRQEIGTDGEVTFVAADPRYQTAEKWSGNSDEYVRLVEEAKRARASVDSIGDDVAMVEQRRVAELAAAEAQSKLTSFIEGFRDPANPKKQLAEKVVDMATDARTTKHYKIDANGKKTLDKTTYDFADFLKQKAQYAGSEVTGIAPELTKNITENGYQLVAVNEKMRMLGEVRELSAFHDVGDYTRRASFFESAGFSPFRVTEKEIGQLKQASMEGSLNQAAAEQGVALPGRDAMNKLIGKTKTINNAGPTHGPFVETPGEGSLIARHRLLVQDFRQLKLDDIVDALGLETLNGVTDPLLSAQRFKDAIHQGSALGAEVSVRHPMDSMRMLMSAMRVEGLPGASDFMRTFRITNPQRALTITGGVVGAGIGAQDEGLRGALEGGIGGALALGTAAYGGKAFLKKWPSKSPFKPGTYGYLPNNLHNAAMALRYSLSFTFDLGRRMEQASIASMRHGLPVILAPKKYAVGHFAEELGNPEQVMTHLRRQLDDVMGHGFAMNADDMERRASAIGLTGFSQQDADAVYAHLLIKQGKMNKMQVREAVYGLGHYAPRSGAERSLNFVLFPFSFQKKMLTTVGDFMLQEPARALLVHEGMRQWYQVREGDETMSSRFAELTEKYAPIADTIARLNNLSYGISGGRFFLEGMVNNKTLMGKISQGLAGVFVPGGSLTPLHQAAGKAGDQMVNFFTPVALTGEDTEDFFSIWDDFAPAVRDFRNIVVGRGANQPGVLSQQLTALTSIGAAQQGGGGAPWSQLRAYNNDKRAIKAEYEDLAAAFDYTTVDGFLESEMGASYKAEVDARVIALGDKYPTGLAKAQYYESSNAIDDKAKAELMADPNRTAGEEMIAQLIEMENEAGVMADMLGLTSDQMLPRLTQDIRTLAVRFSDDVRFRELYHRFFEYRFGPVAEVALSA